MSTVDLRGVIPPLITPLADDGSFDHSGFERLIEHQIAAGVRGLFVLGTSGEGPCFSPRRSAAIVRAAVETAAGRVPVLVGVLEPSAERVVEAARGMAEAGADAVVVTAPYYFSVDTAAVRRHLEAIVDQVPLPIVLYNIPQMTHNAIGADVVATLLEHERVIGMKDSAGNAAGLETLLSVASERPDFCVLQGSEKDALFGLSAGCAGLVPGLANVHPALFVRMAEAVHLGRREEAAELQQAVDGLWTLHTHGPWLACLKQAAAFQGFGSGATLAGYSLAPAACTAIAATVETFRPAPTTTA